MICYNSGIRQKIFIFDVIQAICYTKLNTSQNILQYFMQEEEKR